MGHRCVTWGTSCSWASWIARLRGPERRRLRRTLRFGQDPKGSVLDPNCRAHDLDNLYAVDASFFPSGGAVNPALTIIANALRVADHLQDRLG